VITRPETIENRWDRLYAEFPDIYDAFASYPYTPKPIDIVVGRFPITGADVVDLGSGSGRSAIPLAEHARSVVGVEAEPAMLAVAERAAAEQGVTNVRFVLGTSEALPLSDESADVITAFTSPGDLAEVMRVLRPGGVFVTLDIAPGWYGGEWAGVIGDPDSGAEERSRALVAAGFSYEDVDSVQEYGTTEAMIATYGFIFGKRAIDHIRATGRTSVRWRYRIHWKHKDR
jgi:ubiquinone/menaquinone biosynthesis C-methylase UbiE